MHYKKANELLKRYHSGNCTDEERALVESWYLQVADGQEGLGRKELDSFRRETWKEIEQSLSSRAVKRRWIPYAAASLIFTVFIGGFVFYKANISFHATAEKKGCCPAEDVLPGGNKATLTLADGTLVYLDNAKNGEIIETEGLRISKTQDGQLIYETLAGIGSGNEDLSKEFNSISTPRGGQYQVLLPDGTKVWLNAASSLEYPVRFPLEERKVTLKGEAYFEVAKINNGSNGRIPFIVETSSQKVEVLGTHFNINSYEEEKETLTTLIEGSVRVYPLSNTEQKASVLLKPRQQASLKTGSLQVSPADIEAALAWKNGYFSFNEADIQNIMRQLSRWYDVDVVYAGRMPSETFTGKVPRNISLSKVLEILSYADVNFRIEGKKMFILP